MKAKKYYSESGFSLIEIIVSLVIVAIVAAMMVAYFGKGITESAFPIFRLNAAGKLNAIMEKITVEYNSIPRWSPNSSYTITTSKVIPTPSAATGKGYQYICTKTGTSGTLSTNEPLWPVPGTIVGAHTCSTTLPDTLCKVTDNGAEWQLYAVSTLVPLQTKIAGGAAAGAAGAVGEGSEYVNQTFGGDATVTYKVIHNRFITFVSNAERSTAVIPTETALYGKYLKVTIGLHSTESPRTDETLTALFVLR